MRDEIVRRLQLPGAFDLGRSDTVLSEEERWAEALRIAKMHAGVFNTELGQELLAHWIKVFVARSIVRPGEDAYAQGIREGQADVVRQILEQLEVARVGPPGGEP